MNNISALHEAFISPSICEKTR